MTPSQTTLIRNLYQVTRRSAATAAAAAVTHRWPQHAIMTRSSSTSTTATTTISSKAALLPLPKARIIPPSHVAEVAKAIAVLGAAFAGVPCTNAFSHELGKSVAEYVDHEVRTALRHHGGALVSAGEGSAVALWMLPHLIPASDHSKIADIAAAAASTTSSTPTKQEWQTAVLRSKQTHIGVVRSSKTSSKTLASPSLNPHYHLDFLGRAPPSPASPKVAGAVSAVVQPLLARAAQDNLSVWLEATSPDVVALYEHWGFRVVEEICVGRGRYGADGEKERGGEGVRAWCMMIENRRDA